MVKKLTKKIKEIEVEPEIKSEEIINEIVLEDVSVKEVEVESITVFNRDNCPVRTYSLDIHGKDFKELAKSYASKNVGMFVK